jgi:hypothetical protein
MSSTIYSTRTNNEDLSVRFWKNILIFLLPENNSQVAVPIHKISFIDLLLADMIYNKK